MTARAVVFLQEVRQTAFAKLHAVGTVCEDGLFAAFGGVHIADSTGFGLPGCLPGFAPAALPAVLADLLAFGIPPSLPIP